MLLFLKITGELIITPNDTPETKEEVNDKINRFKSAYPEIVKVNSFKVDNDQVRRYLTNRS